MLEVVRVGLFVRAGTWSFRRGLQRSLVRALPCTFLPQVHPFYVSFSINWQGAERTDELRSCRFARARIWCSQFNRLWLRAGALLRISFYRGRVTIEFASPHLPKCASRCAERTNQHVVGPHIGASLGRPHHEHVSVLPAVVCSSNGNRLAFLRERGCHLSFLSGCAGRHDNGYFYMHWHWLEELNAGEKQYISDGSTNSSSSSPRLSSRSSTAVDITRCKGGSRTHQVSQAVFSRYLGPPEGTKHNRSCFFPSRCFRLHPQIQDDYFDWQAERDLHRRRFSLHGTSLSGYRLGVQGRVFLGDASACTALVRIGSEVCEWRRVAPRLRTDFT